MSCPVLHKLVAIVMTDVNEHSSDECAKLKDSENGTPDVFELKAELEFGVESQAKESIESEQADQRCISWVGLTSDLVKNESRSRALSGKKDRD